MRGRLLRAGRDTLVVIGERLGPVITRLEGGRHVLERQDGRVCAVVSLCVYLAPVVFHEELLFRHDREQGPGQRLRADDLCRPGIGFEFVEVRQAQRVRQVAPVGAAQGQGRKPSEPGRIGVDRRQDAVPPGAQVAGPGAGAAALNAHVAEFVGQDRRALLGSDAQHQRQADLQGDRARTVDDGGVHLAGDAHLDASVDAESAAEAFDLAVEVGCVRWADGDSPGRGRG